MARQEGQVHPVPREEEEEVSVTQLRAQGKVATVPRETASFPREKGHCEGGFPSPYSTAGWKPPRKATSFCRSGCLTRGGDG
jgi:hypothetical protein